MTDETSFQSRVRPWMMACFGEEISADQVERNHRFIEEALELVQSLGCTRCEVRQIVDYVFGRPAGQPDQEVGGTKVTLAALCLANQLDMDEAGERELARVWTKVEQIRAKQAAKPKFSALPQLVEVGPLEAIASFLRERDEALAPDEADDAEREESARVILDMISTAAPARLIDAVPLIVAAMVKARHPVEATNKAGHRHDHIPVDQFGRWTDEPGYLADTTLAELNFGMALIGGWHSKSALARLLIEVWRAARASR